MANTAFDRFQQVVDDNPDSLIAWALDASRHPQERTKAFHKIFGAPIFDMGERPLDDQFSHMDDERVAFRVSFLLSELFELIEKGLGLEVAFSVRGPDNVEPAGVVRGSDNKQLSDAVLLALKSGSTRNLKEVVDGLGDINVVNNGFAVELGIPMVRVDQEVLASNLSKLDDNMQPIIADGSDPDHPAGKILKGPNFVEPQLDELFREWGVVPYVAPTT